MTLLERQDGGDCAHVDGDLVCNKFCSAVQVKKITWGTHTNRVSLLPLLMITVWAMRVVVPVWGIEKHQGGLSDSRKQIVLYARSGNAYIKGSQPWLGS